MGVAGGASLRRNAQEEQEGAAAGKAQANLQLTTKAGTQPVVISIQQPVQDACEDGDVVLAVIVNNVWPMLLGQSAMEWREDTVSGGPPPGRQPALLQPPDTATNGFSCFNGFCPLVRILLF